MFRTVIGNYILLQQPQLPLKQMLVLICCIMSAAIPDAGSRWRSLCSTGELLVNTDMERL